MSWFKKKEPKQELKKESKQELELDPNRCLLASEALWQTMWEVESQSIVTMNHWKEPYKRWHELCSSTEEYDIKRRQYMLDHPAIITNAAVGYAVARLSLPEKRKEVYEWMKAMFNDAAFQWESKELENFMWGLYQQLREEEFYSEYSKEALKYYD